MTPPSKTFTFVLPAEMKAAMQAIRKRDGISEAEQIRRGVQMWLDARGATKEKAERKRGGTRRRS